MSDEAQKEVAPPRGNGLRNLLADVTGALRDQAHAAKTGVPIAVSEKDHLAATAIHTRLPFLDREAVAGTISAFRGRRSARTVEQPRQLSSSPQK